MKKSEIEVNQGLYEYMLSVSLREHEALSALREETAKQPMSIMQIPPEQGQFMALLVKLMGAKKTLEIGTYTGYSALSVALALPDDGVVVACDVSEEWTDVGKPFWEQAGVAEKIDLRIAPALDTLDALLADGQENTFDFAFIDADKVSYDGYYERALSLLRSGGLMAIDNVFLFGSVVPGVQSKNDGVSFSDADISAMQALNAKIKNDPRVDISMLPVADGLTLVRKR